MKRTRDNRGITLAELLVAVAIVGVLVSAIYTIMTTGMKAYNIGFNQAQNQGVLRAAMLSLTTSVRYADTVSASGGALHIDGETIELSGTTLQARNGAATRTIAIGISSLSITSNNAVITITLQAQQNGATSTLTTSVHEKPH